jgi:tRNA pseudouridine38-40 synthase
LNSLTPNDIVIAEVQEEDPKFHARFDACGKTYCYQIFNDVTPSIYHRRFSWHIRSPLTIETMRDASKYLIGCHDFKSFQASSCGAETSIRTVFSIHIQHRKKLIRVFIKANAFLHRMVRNIVGTLVEVGMGRRAPEDVLRVLQKKDRKLAGVTAPASGLFLLKVHYQNLFQ